ncbi:flagellar assembly protein FliW [Mesobacillus zeae]|uniref:Flagellar assembly factor FliW n=1 Tax=Mesobacillus zeae TaxID=1917180 RepID=A0A398B4X3_9BACI|nr:flagellar assembly protein FliW [Mesobacillus zeae]RID84867.1 flagellar assembly protein FliW [Mesobacillus zeae]
MKILTRYHGETEVSEIIKFEKGIPGFPDEKKFTLLPLSEDGVFMALQSINTPGLAFIVSNPFHFFKTYDFQLEDSAIEELGIESEQDVVVYSILTVEDPFAKTTANLQAPIIINGKKLKGKQIILHGEEYKTKHAIFGTAKG